MKQMTYVVYLECIYWYCEDIRGNNKKDKNYHNVSFLLKYILLVSMLLIQQTEFLTIKKFKQCTVYYDI